MVCMKAGFVNPLLTHRTARTHFLPQEIPTDTLVTHPTLLGKFKYKRGAFTMEL